MSGLYIPIIVMLLALVFRGVAFEFRWVAKPKHEFWDLAFSWGALVATFSQGVVLGGLLQGITVQDEHFAGGPFDWLTPFALFCGLGLVAGYALLGTTWLIYKTDGDLQDWARDAAKLALAAHAGVDGYHQHLDAIFGAAYCRALVLVAEHAVSFANSAARTDAAGTAGRRLKTSAPMRGRSSRRSRFFCSGFSVFSSRTCRIWCPNSLTVWQAAAAPSSQMFMLVGTRSPVAHILGYTAFVYWTFRGKVRDGEGYH